MAEMKGRKKRLPLTLSFLTLSDTKKQTSAHKSSRIFEEPNGVVGLGILAALDGDPHHHHHHHHHQNLTFTIGSRTAVLPVSPKSASNPIPILGNKNASENNICEKLSAEKMEFCEGYTCVISHLGNNQMKREYFGGEILGNNNGSSTVSVVSGNGGLPVAVYDSPVTGGCDTAAVGEAGFLSSCFLCKKMLHGLDVFMYRGEKAFCSAECRHRQISIEEKKEKRRSGVRRSIKYSVSPCSVVAA